MAGKRSLALLIDLREPNTSLVGAFWPDISTDPAGIRPGSTSAHALEKGWIAAMSLPVPGKGGLPGVHEGDDKPRPLEASVVDAALSAVAAAACALLAAV